MWLALLFLIFLVFPVHAARQTNGTNQCLSTVSTIDLSGGSGLFAIQLWLWWDAFSTNDDFALEYSVDVTGPSGGPQIDPNNSTGGIAIAVGDATTPTNYEQQTVPQPSAGAWHHYVVNFDLVQNVGANVFSVYIDNVEQTRTLGNAQEVVSVAGGQTLYLMSRACATLFGAGRIAEVAIWKGVILSGANVASLYNSGSGAAATTVQSGNLSYYWQLCGTASPEPATTGGIDMTVTGATQATHPISTCGTASITRKPVVIE